MMRLKSGICLAVVCTSLLAGCETAPPWAAASYVLEPDQISTPPWAESGPSPEDYLRVYPGKARRLGVEAVVRLPCTIRDDRRLDCQPGWEEVPDLGFDAAGIEVSRLFVVKKTEDPNLQPGKQVTLPVRFVLSE
jgi:hypothetical protein